MQFIFFIVHIQQTHLNEVYECGGWMTAENIHKIQCSSEFCNENVFPYAETTAESWEMGGGGRPRERDR